MEAEKSRLVKNLSISLLPKKLSYSDYLVNFELFYRKINNLSGGKHSLHKNKD